MVLIAPSDIDCATIANHQDVYDIKEEREAAMVSLCGEESSADIAKSESTAQSPESASDLETSISMHRGPGLPYHLTILGSLPDDIKTEIFGWILGNKHRFDLTVAHAKNGHPRLWFSSFFPHMREPFSTYLRACSGLRQEGIDQLFSTAVFVNRFSDSAKHFPKLYGNEATALIQHFELDVHFINKIMHERTWPALLNTLVDNMPNLKRLTIVSRYLTSGAAYPQNESGDPTGSVSRHDQERRALLRFGAFVTLRHSTLRVMVVPAESGLWYYSGNHEYKSVVRIELYQSETRRPVERMLRRALPTVAEVTEHADVVMNSTAIRRLKWTELARRDPTTLTLAVDATTSEVPEEHDFYRWVDAKGYMLYQKLQEKNLGRRQEVDKLIDLARRDEWQAATSPVPYTVQGSERGAAPGGRVRGYGNGRPGYRGRPRATRGAGIAGSDVAGSNTASNASGGRGRDYRWGRGAGTGRGGRGFHS